MSGDRDRKMKRGSEESDEEEGLLEATQTFTKTGLVPLKPSQSAHHVSEWLS